MGRGNVASIYSVHAYKEVIDTPQRYYHEIPKVKFSIDLRTLYEGYKELLTYPIFVELVVSILETLKKRMPKLDTLDALLDISNFYSGLFNVRFEGDAIIALLDAITGEINKIEKINLFNNLNPDNFYLYKVNYTSSGGVVMFILITLSVGVRLINY